MKQLFPTNGLIIHGLIMRGLIEYRFARGNLRLLLDAVCANCASSLCARFAMIGLGKMSRNLFRYPNVFFRATCFSHLTTRIISNMHFAHSHRVAHGVRSLWRRELRRGRANGKCPAHSQIHMSHAMSHTEMTVIRDDVFRVISTIPNRIGRLRAPEIVVLRLTKPTGYRYNSNQFGLPVESCNSLKCDAAAIGQAVARHLPRCISPFTAMTLLKPLRLAYAKKRNVSYGIYSSARV